jgi:hypothetical protein
MVYFDPNWRTMRENQQNGYHPEDYTELDVIAHAIRRELIDTKTPDNSDSEDIKAEFIAWLNNQGTLEEFIDILTFVGNSEGYSTTVLEYIKNVITQEDNRRALITEIEGQAAEIGYELRESLLEIVNDYKTEVEEGTLSNTAVIGAIARGLQVLFKINETDIVELLTQDRDQSTQE